MSAKGATINAKDATMCTKDATMSAEDASKAAASAGGPRPVREGRVHVQDGCAKAAARWENRRPRRNVRSLYGYPGGPRGLHFRGRWPIPRLPELASNCVRPAAALCDLQD